MTIAARFAPLAVGEHACTLFDGPDDWSRQAVQHLHHGLAAGDLLMYVGDGSPDKLRADLAGLPGRDELIDAGRLVVVSVAEAYGSAGNFDRAQRARSYAAVGPEAVAQGFRSCRLAADGTTLALTAEHARHMAGYELQVDRVITGQSVTALCGYDHNRVRGLGRVLLAVHPHRRSAPTPDPSFSVSYDGERVRIAGEADVFAAAEFRGALAAAVSIGDDPLVIDLSGLDFLDVGITRTLAGVLGEAVGEGREVVLTGPRPGVLPCLRLFDMDGWLAR